MASKKMTSKSSRPTMSRRRGRPRKNSANTSAKNSESISSKVLHLIGGVMGDNLSSSVTQIKDQVTDQVAVHGVEYLEGARERIAEATDKVVSWGKKHPVKMVAAAAALIAVSGFLYATLNEKSAQAAKNAKAKLKTASASA
jgi:hypothetical protein